MEFLSIGEKVKRLRKQLKMKQRDLECDNVTRAFISMIEIGKRIPSNDIAKYLIDKFKNRAMELGIVLDVDDLYLTRNAKEDAKIYCIKKLQYINKVDDIKEVIDIAAKFELESVLADSYLRLGDSLFENNSFIEAFIGYSSSLDCYGNIGIINTKPYLYNKLGLCRLKELQFIEALNYFNIANLYALEQSNEDIKKRSIYNIAICNKKLNKIEDALESLGTCLSFLDKEMDFSLYVSANILKATCYEAQGLIDMSIEVLLNLLQDFKDSSHPLLGLIYNDLGAFYLEKSDFDKSLDYFDMSYKIRKSSDKTMAGRTLIEKSFVFIKQNSYEQAIYLLEEGITLISKNNDIAYLLKGYYSLADIYTHLKIYEEAEKKYMTILNLFKNVSIDISRDEIVKVYVKLSSLYLEKGNYSKLKDTLLLLQDVTTK